MKKTFLFVVAASVILLTTSCSGVDSNQNERLNSLMCPIIVLAKAQPTADTYGSITIVDAKGQVETFIGKFATGAALIASYEKGDTLINCKRN